jgi:hypothetical protein
LEGLHGSFGFGFSLAELGGQLLVLSLRSVEWPFLTHTLAVTETYVRLIEAHRLGQLTFTGFEAEPACWRRFAGPGGGRVTLKPDAFLTVELGRYEDRWFIEVDRGTESPATLLRKLETYRRYWQTGTEQARFGVHPRTLWLVPDAKRYETLIDVLGRYRQQATQPRRQLVAAKGQKQPRLLLPRLPTMRTTN